MSLDGAKMWLRRLGLRPGSSWTTRAVMGAEENQTAEPKIRAEIHFPSISTSPGEMLVSELLAPGSLQPRGTRGLVLPCCPCSALGSGAHFGSGMSSVDRDGGGKIHPEPCSVLCSTLASIPVKLCTVWL